ncbi:anthranilate phosphoribosyltransferase TrpD [Phellopilus nigrolimitatus]|nr:anthranilate phosphoribosyltransferase TrpD [Phellopilus nigrolimitatus]
MSILNSETPELFLAADLQLTLDHLFTPNALLPVQIGALLTALHVNRVERRHEMLTAATENLRNRALKIEKNTFNVSTTATVVAAGAGARVCKHGSGASTSLSGSADILQSLGCLFITPSFEKPSMIPRIPFAYILARLYYPALEIISPFQKALPFCTIFNLIGPLVNPVVPNGIVLGVAEKSIGEPFARSLRDSGISRALVVCGAEGLDEINCAGDTHAWEVKNGVITQYTLHPSQFGLRVHQLSLVSGGTAAENSETFKMLLRSGAQIPNSLQPVLDFVLLNTSALLVIAGLASDFKDGVKLARESITSGKAWDALQAFKIEGERAAALLAKST